MDELGLTHISVSCDIADICGRIADYGGQVLSGTDIGNAVFVRDPDGQLVELLPLAYADSLRPTCWLIGAARSWVFGGPAFGVRVPASSANLGAGFDALGLALSLYLELRVGEAPADTDEGSGGTAWTTDEHHLAIRTFHAEGGEGPVAARAQFAGG